MLSSTTAGPKIITATYSGDPNFLTSSATTSHSVNAANTSTVITNAAFIASTPSVVGQQLGVNWNVTVVPFGATGTGFDGTVTVSDGLGASCTAPAGAGTCLMSPFLGSGLRSIAVTYLGNANYVGSSSSIPHQVNRVPTFPNISNAFFLAAGPSIVGQPYSVEVFVGLPIPDDDFVPATAKAAARAKSRAAVPVGPTGTISVSDGTGGACTITLPAGHVQFDQHDCGNQEHHCYLQRRYDVRYKHEPRSASHSQPGQHHGFDYFRRAGSIRCWPGCNCELHGLRERSGAGTPTGNVLVSDGVNSCTGTVAAGSCVVALLTPGVRTLTATYQGDTNFSASPASTGAGHQVNKADTTTTIMSDSPDPSVFGQSLTVAFNVVANPPAIGTPTGNVVVTVSGGAETCTGTVAAGSCSIVLTGLGPRTLIATYQGDTNYNGGASGGAAHQVNKADSFTSIVLDTPDSSSVGQNVTVSFNVIALAPSSGTPSGNVTITVAGGAETCTGTVAAGSCVLALTSAGSRTLTATYEGNTGFNGSSDTETHTVTQANTTLTSLTDSPDPSVTGQPYTVGFTLNVTAPGAGTPTGTVTVTDGTGGMCTATLPATSCSLTSTSIGVKTVTFTYNGDANFNTSSNTAGHLVNKANTTTTINADTPDPSVFGQNYAVTASVAANSPGGGTPTGTITVTDGTNNCTITLPATSCDLPSTSVGPKTLTATYNGDANYNASSPSAGVPHTVNKADTVTTITSDNPDSSTVGQNVTVNFTAAAAAPGAGTPTGTVTITVSGGSETCTGTLAAGLGSCTLALTVPGARTLTATYNGDTNFNTAPTPSRTRWLRHHRSRRPSIRRACRSARPRR
jgi:hypothetical protein